MAVCGRAVNLQSPKQLQKILFEDMGLKPRRRPKRFVYHECGGFAGVARSFV